MMIKTAFVAVCAMTMTGCGTIYSVRNQDAMMASVYLKHSKNPSVTQAIPATKAGGKTVYDTHIDTDWLSAKKCIQNTEGKHSMEEYEANPKLIKRANKLKEGYFVLNPFTKETLQTCDGCPDLSK